MTVPEYEPVMSPEELRKFELLADELEAERRSHPVFQPFPGGELILQTYDGEAFGYHPVNPAGWSLSYHPLVIRDYADN
jgi:hypothetical protein